MNPLNHAIGFTNKYYTLWYIGEKHPVYIKNISMDIDVVKSKYPELEIYMDLKGMYSRYYGEKKVPIIFDGTFSKGKYKGILVEDISNEDYMKWYVESGVYSTNEEKEAIIKEVEKNGKVKWNNSGWFERIIPQEELDEIEKITSEILSGNFELLMEKNPDEFGDYTYYDKFDNWYSIQFENVKEMEYAGYFYGLPILNGKAKRVKNKTLKLTEVEFNGNKSYIVKNFEIVKK